MRAILVIAAVVLILALIGWIKFGSDGDRATMTIETDRIQHETREAVERSEDAIDEARRDFRRAVDEERDEDAREPRASGSGAAVR